MPSDDSLSSALHRIPRAPGWLPVLGHLPRLVVRPLPFLESVTQISDIVTFYFGKTPAYLITSPQLVHQMLVAESGSFTKGVHYDKLSELLGESLSTVSGDVHRERRHIVQPAFSHQHVERQVAVMHQAVSSLIDAWRPGDIVAVDDAMRQLSLSIIARAMCSTELDADSLRTVQRDLPDVMRGVAWRVLLSAIPIDRLPLPMNNRFSAANSRLRSVAATLVQRYRTANTDRRGLLSVLLEAQNPGSGIGLDDDSIHDEFVNLLFAGTETTANAMAWMWYALGHHPHIAESLHAEAVAGRDDLARRVAQETLRLYPPPWLVSRKAGRDVDLHGFVIPKNAQVLFSPYAIHRDRRNYTDASSFIPDRWLPENNPRQTRHAYLPFGAGPQNCVGQGLALLEMTTVATVIASRYRLVPVSTTKLRASATLTPSRLRMRVEGHPELT
jgi:cytochrome P450